MNLKRYRYLDKKENKKFHLCQSRKKKKACHTCFYEGFHWPGSTQQPLAHDFDSDYQSEKVYKYEAHVW